jgi:ABC-2 type transport system permease protein
MFDRIKTILIKEFLQIFRDPRMRFTIFVPPLIQVLVFGYAATMDITHVPTAAFDRDNTKQSREILRDFSYSKYFDINYYLYEEKQVREIIDKFDALGVIRMDRGFGRNIIGNKSAELQFVVDGTDSNSAMIVLGYAGQIIGNYNYKALKERVLALLPPGQTLPYVDFRERRWFNANLESKNYYLPGVIALIVSIMSLLLSSMAIVREKEIGTMEQLIVSPIRPIELILGKITPFILIAFVQVIMITVVGVLWFKVPIRGSLILLFGCTFIYLLTTLGVGLFISTLCSTQQEAMMSVFLFFFPATLLSGFAYPIANMPQVIQIITYANPLRYFLVILRSIFLKGVGLDILWTQILPLLIIGVVILTLSTLRFQKNIG